MHFVRYAPEFGRGGGGVVPGLQADDLRHGRVAGFGVRELVRELASEGVLPRTDARLNTETPGSAIDRLSIIALRIYHLEEQAARNDADPAHLRNVQQRLERCREQHADLSRSLAELLADIFAGHKILKVYRQMKMYNDPTMNPYVYRATRLAG